MSPVLASASVRRAAACAAACAVLLGPLAGCVDKDDGALPTLGGLASAQLRVVHAIPDAPTVEVRLDDAAATVTGLAYRQATTSYLAVAAGDRRVRVTPTGATTPAIDVTPTLAAGSATTIVASGLLGTATTAPIVVTDTLTAPAGGQVRLRVVHAGPTVGLVDVYLSATDAALPAAPTITGLAFRTVASSLTVPAGTYRVRLTPSGLRTPTVDVTTAALAAGTVAKLIAVDPPASDTAGTRVGSVVVVTDRVP